MNLTELQTHIEDTIVNNNFKKIGISISGGMDSSILLYVLCNVLSKNQELLNSVQIVPITGIGDTRIEIVDSVMDFVKAAFPLVQFYDHQIFKYHDDFRVKWAKYHVPFHTSLYKDNVIDVFIHAGTRNMPADELDKIDFNRKSMDANRSLDENTVIAPISFRNNTLYNAAEGYKQWNIFMNYTKKLTAGLYDELNLHDSLAKLTWSCTARSLDDAYNAETKQLGVPCGRCYWCAEKKWAVGYF